ncbi:hypothetical protein [Brevundimonas lenta]|uniref:Uncharacterized protein n=1 Tax=Brevundimonas lenta TaxID=424796 RepID=A0A7W6NR17_9CAUL|nr:hypothetical protein [Brevundimonas lenta]MBB4083705.1 hypothetical protein [Brevundimonas lenta]
MNAILIVLILLALGVGIVVWATRGKKTESSNAPLESDTAWNDPVTPGEPARPIHYDDAAAPPRTDTRP